MATTLECHIVLGYLPFTMVPWHQVLPDAVTSQLCMLLDPSSLRQGGPLGVFVQQLLNLPNIDHVLDGQDATDFLVDYILATTKSNVILTGHSMGGIIAQVIASRSKLLDSRKTVQVVTFNSPSVAWNSNFLKIDKENLSEGRVLSVRSEKDAVSGLDLSESVLTIPCDGSVASCHSMTYMVCELWRSCAPPDRPLPCHCRDTYEWKDNSSRRNGKKDGRQSNRITKPAVVTFVYNLVAWLLLLKANGLLDNFKIFNTKGMTWKVSKTVVLDKKSKKDE